MEMRNSIHPLFQEIQLSVYTSGFNLNNGLFDLVGAFKNWSTYAKEIVIATIEADNDDIDIITEAKTKAFGDNPDAPEIVIVPCQFELSDPFFDGKLKNAALQKCSYDVVIQQDLDERLGGNVSAWASFYRQLLEANTNFDAIFIPVVDLYKDKYHYKSVGQKWYMHRKKGMFRGPVNFAKREDGTIDTDKSDTCELIDENGNLVKTASFLYDMSEYPMFPIVFHYGYLDLDKRVQANKIWQPVWSARKGEEVFVETDKEKLEEIEAHPLPFEI